MRFLFTPRANLLSRTRLILLLPSIIRRQLDSLAEWRALSLTVTLNSQTRSKHRLEGNKVHPFAIRSRGRKRKDCFADRTNNLLELDVLFRFFLVLYSLVEGVAEEIRKPNPFKVKYLLETNEKRDDLQVMIIFAGVNLFDFLFIVVGPMRRASSQKQKWDYSSFRHSFLFTLRWTTCRGSFRCDTTPVSMCVCVQLETIIIYFFLILFIRLR